MGGRPETGGADQALQRLQPAPEIIGALRLRDPAEPFQSLQGLGQQRIDQLQRVAAGGEADLLVAIGVHDVVDPGPALDRAGLAAGRPVAGEPLQLQGDMLDDMAEPRPLLQPLHEAAAPAVRAAVPLQPRQPPEEPVGKALDPVAGPILQPPQIDLDTDHGRVAVEMRAPVNAGLGHPHRFGQQSRRLNGGRAEKQGLVPHVRPFSCPSKLSPPVGAERR